MDGRLARTELRESGTLNIPNQSQQIKTNPVFTLTFLMSALGVFPIISSTALASSEHLYPLNYPQSSLVI
jgi:hypothetical protein